jgi:predicted RNA-binding protein (virulence factor B family)
MIKLGEMQELVIAKKVEFGVYLVSPDDVRGEDKILLPQKQVPEEAEAGDKITVFVYRDSSDRKIATTKRPRIVMGEIAYLKVAEMSKIGAFMNWGLEKDLFLPFKEQVGEIKLNGEYLVGLYIDKSDRLCATMNLFNVLRTDSPYKVNDMVNGTVFSLKRGLGAMVAVEGKYLGLIHEGEILRPMRPGDEVELRVSNVKEDGKLDLSLKDAPRLQIDKDGEKVLSVLMKNKGQLNLNDESSPDAIYATMNMSKGSFKKAIGRLMKKGLIDITREGIRLAEKKAAFEEKNHGPKTDYKSNDRNKRSSRSNDSRNFGYKSNDNRSSGYKSNDGKNTGYKGNDNGSSGYKSNDNRSSGYKSNESKSTGYRSNDNGSSGYKSNDNRSSGYKSNDGKNTGFKSNDNRSSGYKSNDERNSSYKSNDSKNSNYRSTDNKNGKSNFKSNDVRQSSIEKNKERNNTTNKRK